MALTDKDLQALRELFDTVFDEKLGSALEPGGMLSYLPTREEFYKKMDEVMKELKDMREEFTVLSGRSSDHSDRIENLEVLHPENSHQGI